LTAAARAVVNPRGDDPAAAHALLTAIGHLATPATKRARVFLDERVNKEIMARRDRLDDPDEASVQPPAWSELVIPKHLYRVSIKELKQPDVTKSDPFEAAAWLWNWQINSRWREQMRTKWPQLAFHGEARRVDRSTPVATDPGGQCCRWTCGGMKTCPLQCWSRKK
jgi:hypothetical protein